MDYYLDGGDSEMYETNLRPYISVRGNMDLDTSLPEKVILPTPFGNLFMRHVPYIEPSEIEENNIKIFIHGHTHKPEFNENNGLITLCPGSLMYPRSVMEETYMIVDIDENKVTMKLYNLETNKKVFEKIFK